MPIFQGSSMLNKSNAHELIQIAKETGALVFRGPLRYPGLVDSVSPLQGDANAKTGDWEIGSENIPDVLYELRDRQVLLILAPEDGGDPVHLCGICGFTGRTFARVAWTCFRVIG